MYAIRSYYDAEQGVIDEGRLAGAGDPGDTGHRADRNVQVHLLQIVAAGTQQAQPAIRERRAAGRHGNLLAAREIISYNFV